jgi:hypothetical protein
MLGLRFGPLMIARGAVINSAWIELTAIASGLGVSAVLGTTEAADSAAPFQPVAFTLTQRTFTNTLVGPWQCLDVGPALFDTGSRTAASLFASTTSSTWTRPCSVPASGQHPLRRRDRQPRPRRREASFWRQQVVDRPGWVAGGYVVFELHTSVTGSDVNIAAFEADPLSTPRLTIVFTP